MVLGDNMSKTIRLYVPYGQRVELVLDHNSSEFTDIAASFMEVMMSCIPSGAFDVFFHAVGLDHQEAHNKIKAFLEREAITPATFYNVYFTADITVDGSKVHMHDLNCEVLGEVLIQMLQDTSITVNRYELMQWDDD
jgi:hypothetical protein